jgi:hypothetical protein
LDIFELEIVKEGNENWVMKGGYLKKQDVLRWYRPFMRSVCMFNKENNYIEIIGGTDFLSNSNSAYNVKIYKLIIL